MKHRLIKRVPLRDHEDAHAALAALGLTHAQVLDLASSHNPFGPPPGVARAIAEADLRRYPHPTARPAREAIAQRFATKPERVLLGHGAFELAWTLARVLVSPGDAVLSVEPGSQEFAAAARQYGARVVQWRAVERRGHRVELDQVAELMALEKPSVVSLCAPSTPSGASVAFAQLKNLATQFSDTRFVVDQSLLALSDDHADLELHAPDNVVCVRSLGKELGLCGLRVGYALADPALVERAEAARPAFSTSAPAQAAAAAAMCEGAFVAESRERMLRDRDRLAFVLGKLGLATTPSVAAFAMVRVARAGEVAHELLAEHRILVHECSAYGLPDHVRISGVSEAAERQLERALRAVLERRKLTHGRDC
jgi:histidinol-phosphate/aromatic aminotransferase/cobyric acid decarboxylase-like protein